MAKRVTLVLSVVGLTTLLAIAASAIMTETVHTRFSRTGESIRLYEDTGVNNSQLILTTIAKDFARKLMAINIVCTNPATLTVESEINRTITSGVVDVLLPNIRMVSTTSGGMYTSIYLLPADTVTVTIPAAGAGINCSAMVIEEVL